ncbi:epimerase family protein SDR39U1 isoform X2 [Pteropus alecto]|uniref:epimerase family protein SDR39U1 isoform X2 n=1 Tax=Pteropus alecto TaxID=9402 RepID=UPI0003F14101|nr:epimerase family protein SDR39U1 isoform X2 [Pteropus alecto]XP_039726353.1 epimerase family protein SDR39U1 isoform X2 [Pteropus giganteus]
MRVLVGGGTGFIGTALTQFLKARGHEVTLVSRKPGPSRITWDELATLGLPRCDAVVNLAGENILNPLRRWNETFQKEVVSSRLETTRMLARAITEAPQPRPQAWVLVTGVGYYQPSLTAEYDEDSPGGDFDFFANLVTKWEAAAKLPGDSTRQVVVRSGIVLGRGGGAIGHMLLPFRLGLGGPIGSGHQFLPWIHIRDLVGILAHALEASHVQGILNGVAPASTPTNAEFAKALGAALGRPAFIPLPSTIVQAVFGQERAIMLLEGQKVVPRRTLAAGYQYSFPELGAALKEVIA